MPVGVAQHERPEPHPVGGRGHRGEPRGALERRDPRCGPVLAVHHEVVGEVDAVPAGRRRRAGRRPAPRANGWCGPGQIEKRMGRDCTCGSQGSSAQRSVGPTDLPERGPRQRSRRARAPSVRRARGGAPSRAAGGRRGPAGGRRRPAPTTATTRWPHSGSGRPTPPPRRHAGSVASTRLDRVGPHLLAAGHDHVVGASAHGQPAVGRRPPRRGRRWRTSRRRPAGSVPSR